MIFNNRMDDVAMRSAWLVIGIIGLIGLISFLTRCAQTAS